MTMDHEEADRLYAESRGEHHAEQHRGRTSERFRVEPSGRYFAIYWGPTLICTVWSDEAFTQALCDMLEATRQMDEADNGPVDVGKFLQATGAHMLAWQRFRDMRQAGR